MQSGDNRDMGAACDRCCWLDIIRADNGHWRVVDTDRILNDEKDREVYIWD